MRCTCGVCRVVRRIWRWVCHRRGRLCILLCDVWVSRGPGRYREECKAYCRSGLGGLAGAAGLGGMGSPNIEPRMLDGRPAGLVPLVIELARSTFSRTCDDVAWTSDTGRA